MDQKLKNNTKALRAELEEARRQLQEANDTIDAIRNGQVDALVVKSGEEHQLYTLHSADHAYRVFIEKMTEGAATLNEEGMVIYANSQFSSMVRMPLSQIIGASFEQFVAESSRPVFISLFSKSAREDCKGEIELQSAGTLLPVLLSMTALGFEYGVSVNIIITDLSLQKATLRLLEENNRELEASNHDLQQFASVASHDLQEPLRKIQMFTNLIKSRCETSLGQEEMQYLNKVIGSANRMKTLIMDVLTYSKLSAHEGEFSAVDLSEAMKDLLEDFELMIEEKQAVISIGKLPVIEGNRGQLRQLFQNLISNALKFSKAGEVPVIEIKAELIAEKTFNSSPRPDGSFCLLSIKDNGIGFDEKYTVNVFSLFERLHAKDAYEGTGIGLAIAKKIVEKHGGLISVKSSEGNGADFKIILPMKQKKNGEV